MLRELFQKRTPAQPTAAKGFALVELFTSEGCSSCPPADVVLGEVAGADNVVALGFHVDYWDHLGWPEPFGSRMATERQYWYAAGAGTSRVYTPQMVVNGTESFVGSDRRAANAAVNAAVAAPLEVASPEVASLEVEHEPGAITVHHRSVPAGTSVNVAAVQPTATSVVERGENAGRTLVHHAVVRDFQRRSVAPEGLATTVDIAIPDGLQVVVFLQDESRSVLAVG